MGRSFVNSLGELIKEESCTVPRGEAAIVFLKRLLELENALQDHISLNKPMIPLTEAQQKSKAAQENCFHCHKPLNGPRYLIGESEDYNCDDHDHYTVRSSPILSLISSLILFFYYYIGKFYWRCT